MVGSRALQFPVLSPLSRLLHLRRGEGEARASSYPTYLPCCQPQIQNFYKKNRIIPATGFLSVLLPAFRVVAVRLLPRLVGTRL